MVQPLRQLSAFPDIAKIAIIEDDNSVHNLIMGSMLMEFEKVEAFQFRNAHDAIHEIWENHLVDPPQLDALFIDIFLEDHTSGIDVLEYCQFIPQSIPVILMSSQFSDEQLEKVSKLNSTPVLLRKPFEPSEVIQLIKWVFDLNLRRQE